MRRQTIGSLFSGIGGLELGLESLGLGPVVWQCDNDPVARAVLRSYWPRTRLYTDVRELLDGQAARPSIICGGFPCQPVSVAGLRRAQRDPRWLWPFFASVLARLRPPLVFIENVPGLVRAGLRDVLADLARLGFDAEWGCFSAAQVAAPHRRSRLFLLAHAHRPGLEEREQQPARQERPPPQRSRLPPAPWPAEPDVGRVAYGVPARVDRIRLLGNACVPALAAHAFQELMARTGRATVKGDDV